MSEQPVSSETAEQLAERAWRAMRTLVLDRYDRRADVSAALGMSFVRIKALRRLAHGAMTMSDLAAELLTDAPYTTVVVDDLEKRGFVQRRTDPHDRRRKLVVATPAGLRTARSAQRMLDVAPAALTGLPEADLDALDRILQAVMDAAGCQRR